VLRQRAAGARLIASSVSMLNLADPRHGRTGRTPSGAAVTWPLRGRCRPSRQLPRHALHHRFYAIVSAMNPGCAVLGDAVDERVGGAAFGPRTLQPHRFLADDQPEEQYEANPQPPPTWPQFGELLVRNGLCARGFGRRPQHAEVLRYPAGAVEVPSARCRVECCAPARGKSLRAARRL
jgi:hypothetical protein